MCIKIQDVIDVRLFINKNCTVILTVLHFPNPSPNIKGTWSIFKSEISPRANCETRLLYDNVFFDLLHAPFHFKVNFVAKTERIKLSYQDSSVRYRNANFSIRSILPKKKFYFYFAKKSCKIGKIDFFGPTSSTSKRKFFDDKRSNMSFEQVLVHVKSTSTIKSVYLTNLALKFIKVHKSP